MLFYLQYAARNLWRNRRWSLFAVFSIAAGVATIVALRSLGLAIADSLTANLRASNHGDISISRDGGTDFSFSFGGEGQDNGYAPGTIEHLTEWTQQRGGEITTYTSTIGVQIAAPGVVTAGRPQFVSSYFIDPAAYPLTDDIFALEPAGVPLGELFQGGNEVVISRNLADTLNAEVGDMVRVSGTTEEFVVRGIVPAEAEAGLRNLFGAFFGFAYFDQAQAEALSVGTRPNGINITLPEDQRPTNDEDTIAIERELNQITAENLGSILTVPDLLRQNQTFADILGRFIVVMGLGAMLIGGVGIINTMLVMVRRRTEEVAALKTFGLKARQVGFMFMAEAFLLGLVGSLFGGVIGVFLGGLANAYGETLIQQSLAFRVYPEAILFGAVIGLIVSVVFGVLPVLTASRIRPAIILRPNETHIARSGVLQSIFALVLVVLALGLIAGQILGNVIFGIIGVAVTLIILGILIGLLWILVWLLGWFPSFGNVDLKLALRNLRARRARTATTLLALSAGMFALSSITFFGAGTRELLQQTLSGTLGGNVLILPLLPSAIANPLIDNRLDSLEGVRSRTRFYNYSGEIVAINGEPTDAGAAFERRQELRDAMREAGRNQDFGRMAAIGEELEALASFFVNPTMRDTTGDDFGAMEVSAGRPLRPEDRDQRVTVMMANEGLREAGVNVGATVTIEIDNTTYDFEVVGLISQEELNEQPFRFGISFGDMTIPPDSLPRSAAETNFQLTLADVDPAYLDEVLLNLSSLPLVFSLDITFIDSLLQRFIEQFSALPILVGLLSLGAAAVIMANTVALATLERRRQIGILKAVGLKGRRVLGVMLLENVLVSILGAVLGVGFSALGVALMSSLGGQELLLLVPRDSTVWAVLLVVAAVLIGVGATFASARVAIQERALNVLRYE